MYKYIFEVYEQKYRYPKNIVEARCNLRLDLITLDPRYRMIKGKSIDDCLKKAITILKDKMFRVIRSCSLCSDKITAVVYSGSHRPPRKKISERGLKLKEVKNGQ
jgi:hypothetical protein